MSPRSPAHRDMRETGRQLRKITSIHPISEEENPEHSPNNPSKAQSDIHPAAQEPRTTSSPPTSSPATPTTKMPSISPLLGRMPASSRHYYLKEMWPGQPLCHLCLKQYKKTNRAIRALPCGDIFHRACLDHLLGCEDGRCPSCEAEIPDEWYLPHVYDPARPLGGPCLCHPVSNNGGMGKAGAESRGGSSSNSTGVLVIRKLCKSTKRLVVRCIPGRKPKSYVGYKTETGQTRYVEKGTSGALSDARLGDVDEGA